ncbi:hypothetical protein C2845_PM01G00690 [Panicum miliaceum]|uniref:K-box domain-containing protein n=1 Tax=Panicum miliaceum TaxID=4540 RepID=A0A3L6TT30_PANMI|nr:hypothetical protein C2845_PM01G00690 [Panicum miliaceum]
MLNQVKADAEDLAKKLEALEAYKRKLLGEKLERCSIEELHGLEVKLEKSLRCIRGRKTQLLEEQVNKLKEKEMTLRKNNEELREKCKNQPPLLLTHARPVITVEDDHPEQNDDRMDVETELYIGLPGRDHRRNKVAEVRSG